MIKQCLLCGKDFEVTQFQHSRKYCFDGCYNKKRYARAGQIGRPRRGKRRPDWIDPEDRKVPPEVWIERERALHEPMTATQIAFGDPPLCRSALMKS